MLDLDEDEKAHLEANIAWLQSAGPDDWHRVMLDFNWSEPLYVLDWIVRQPDCDAATALTIFWKGQPECWLAEEGSGDEEPNGYDYLNEKICAYIADRVRAKGYTRSEIAFTPDTWTKSDYVQLVAGERALKAPNIRTHPDLILDRMGREVGVDADFLRRYPEKFQLSAYSEWLDEALEQGVFETPKSIATEKRVAEIERVTMSRLPAWLKPRLEADGFEDVRSEAVYFALNLFFVGILVTALLMGGLSRFGGVIGWVVGIALTLQVAYSALSSARDMKHILGCHGLGLPKPWLAAAAVVSLALGSGLSHLVVSHMGSLREAYGALPLIVVGLAIVLPALWFVLKAVVQATMTRSVLR